MLSLTRYRCGWRVSTQSILLLFLLMPLNSDGGLSGIKVLWMNNDKDKKTSNIDARSTSKLDVAPVGDCGGIFDDTTDRLLQDAIRNIDQLTSVARKLSSENMHSLLSPGENNIPMETAKRNDHPSAMLAHAVMGGAPQLSRGKCRVTFRVKNDNTQLGDSFLVLGSNELGNWRAQNALKLTTTGATFPFWGGTVDMASDGALEYKFVIQSANGDLKWEPGSNRHFQAQGNSGANIRAEYGQANARVTYDAAPTGRAEPAPAAQAPPQAMVQRPQAPRPAPAQAVAAPAGGGGSGRELAMPGEALTAKVHFRVKCNTNPGEAVSVCGSVATIGGWDPSRALQLRSSKEEYPFWFGEAEVALSQVKDCIRYKYVVKSSDSDNSRWEDAIADRTIVPERRPGQVGVLTANTETFVDDGPFNQLQRTCTFVRELNPRAAPRAAAPSIAAAPSSMQWEARVHELEEECTSLRERAKSAETAVDALSAELEEERRQNEEIQKQMQFVEALIARMKKMEEQVAVLEQTKEVLITRSESLTDVARAAGPAGDGVSVAQTIDAGLAGARQILTGLDSRIPR